MLFFPFFFFVFFFPGFFSIFFFSLFFLTLLLFFLSFFLMKGLSNNEILSQSVVYECSYSEINTESNFYTLHFFLVSLSFMLFDLEIILFIPFIYSSVFNFSSLFSFLFFFFFLILGLFFEFCFKVF